jgi:RNA polymerase sigma-70 factor (ECF subfamily)
LSIQIVTKYGFSRYTLCVVQYGAMDNKVLLLVKRAIKGDEDAFGELYKLYVNKIFRFVKYLLSDREVAQDITQNAFVNAWKSINRFSIDKGTFQAYLYTIARNLARDYIRKKKTLSLFFYEQTISDGNILIEKVIVKEKQEKINEMLKELKMFDRQLVVLRFFEELTFKEIAQIIGKKESAVRVQTHRALKKIKKLYKNNL